MCRTEAFQYCWWPGETELKEIRQQALVTAKCVRQVASGWWGGGTQVVCCPLPEARFGRVGHNAEAGQDLVSLVVQGVLAWQVGTEKTPSLPHILLPSSNVKGAYGLRVMSECACRVGEDGRNAG